MASYVLEEKKLIRNLTLLRDIQEQSGAHIIMALKAFSMYHVFPLLKQYLHGAATSSVNEAKLVEEYWGGQSFVYSPVYSKNDIGVFKGLASHLVFNSLGQLERYSKDLNTVSLGLRINPGYSEIKTDLYNPSSPSSRLGVHIDSLDSLPDGIEGIHLHALCENNVDVLEKMFGIIEDKFSDSLYNLKWINFGGGHAITRKGYDVSRLILFLKALKSKYKLDVYLEPGSAITWDTGYLEAEVLDVITTKNKREVAMLDCSFTAHMPDCLEMPYTPVVSKATTDGEFPYVFGGGTCLAGDQLGVFKFNEPLEIGDKVRFEDMMHYTMVKTTQFNGMSHPSICIEDTKGERILLKDISYNAYKSAL